MTERRFSPEPESVPRARRFVLERMGTADAPTRNAVAVMVSELATNVVSHAHTDFYVRVDRDGDTICVEVEDSGTGTPTPQPLPPPTALHGRGLHIVDELSDEWGVEPSRATPGKSVWFRLARRPASSST